MYSNSPYYSAPAKSRLSVASTASSSPSIHMYAFPPASPTPSTSSFGSISPRHVPNFEGSWLDIESDDEDDAPALRRLTTSRAHRKSSSAKESPARSGFNLRDLTTRGSARLRKLTSL
ncbi:hypothetical protein IWQ57_006228, partial [Coemansia nantahalensis]